MSKIKTYSIYSLVCPLDGQIKYIGISTDLKRRYSGHVQSPGGCLKEWIFMLKQMNKMPTMNELVSGLSKNQAYKAEKEMIVKLQKELGSLLNHKYITTGVAFVPPINYLAKVNDDNN
jgi:predicted GIY-YIG superfamily endonuclease